MNAVVVRELGVERDREDVSLCGGDPAAVDRRQHVHSGPRVGDPRRADEDRVDRPAVDPSISTSASKLRTCRPKALRSAAMSISPRWSSVEHDQARARAQDGRAGLGEVAQRLGQPLALDSQRHRGRLAAGDHQPVETLQVGRHAHLPHLRPQPPQHARVCLEVPLQGEDPDRLGHGATSRAARGAALRRACAPRGSPWACRGPRRPGRRAQGRRSASSPRRSRGRGPPGPPT